MKKLVVILGAGGCARELYLYCKELWGYDLDSSGKIQFVFVDDATETRELRIQGKTLPVEKEWKFAGHTNGATEVGFFIGISSPQAKRTMVKKAIAAGLKPYPTLVHPRAFVQDSDCKLGNGGYIAPGCVLTTNITLGDYVLLNYSCTIGHDAKILDYSTCNPGCHISGNVEIGSDSLLGAGTFVLENLKVPSNTVAGAQSCIVRTIGRAGTTVVGVPSQIIKG